MNKLTQSEAVALALGSLYQFKEKVEEVMPLVQVNNYRENYEQLILNLAFQFEWQGAGYYYSCTEIVYDEAKGKWVCFFDGSGPNDSYYDFVDGKAKIFWMG